MKSVIKTKDGWMRDCDEVGSAVVEIYEKEAHDYKLRIEGMITPEFHRVTAKMYSKRSDTTSEPSSMAIYRYNSYFRNKYLPDLGAYTKQIDCEKSLLECMAAGEM